MFCNKCGTEVSANDRFCPSCGNPIVHYEDPNGGQSTDEGPYDVPDSSKKNKYVGIGAIVIAVILAVILFFVFKGVFGGSCEKTAEQFMKGVLNGNANTVMDTFSDKELAMYVEYLDGWGSLEYFYEEYDDDYDEDDFDSDDVTVKDFRRLMKEAMEEYSEDIVDEYEDYDIKYEVTDTDELSKKEIKSIYEYYEDYDSYDDFMDSLKEAARVEIELTATDGDDEEESELELVLLKIGSKWYVSIFELGF